MKKPETKFQDYLMEKMKEQGLSVKHIEPLGIASFPDLLVMKMNKYVLIELKTVKCLTTRAFSSLFEDGQLAWHSSHLKEANDSVMIAIESQEDDVVYFIWCKNEKDYEDMMHLNIKQVLLTFNHATIRREMAATFIAGYLS